MTPADNVTNGERGRCPNCNGVPVRPDVEECRGCLECDFTGTREGYEQAQQYFREAMQAAFDAGIL